MPLVFLVTSGFIVRILMHLVGLVNGLSRHLNQPKRPLLAHHRYLSLESCFKIHGQQQIQSYNPQPPMNYHLSPYLYKSRANMAKPNNYYSTLDESSDALHSSAFLFLSLVHANPDLLHLFKQKCISKNRFLSSLDEKQYYELLNQILSLFNTFYLEHCKPSKLTENINHSHKRTHESELKQDKSREKQAEGDTHFLKLQKMIKSVIQNDIQSLKSNIRQHTEESRISKVQQAKYETEMHRRVDSNLTYTQLQDISDKIKLLRTFNNPSQQNLIRTFQPNNRITFGSRNANEMPSSQKNNYTQEQSQQYVSQFQQDEDSLFLSDIQSSKSNCGLFQVQLNPSYENKRKMTRSKPLSEKESKKSPNQSSRQKSPTMDARGRQERMMSQEELSIDHVRKKKKKEKHGQRQTSFLSGEEGA